jgi:hypothetical protein
MNSFREALKHGLGQVALEQSYAFGDFIIYQDRATEPKMKLRCIPDKEEFELTHDGALQEQHTHRNFCIPRQLACTCLEEPCICGKPEHFPPEGEPSHNAIIYYEDADWAVDKWTRDSVGAAYTAETIKHIARRTEIRI